MPYALRHEHIISANNLLARKPKHGKPVSSADLGQIQLELVNILREKHAAFSAAYKMLVNLFSTEKNEDENKEYGMFLISDCS